MAIVLSRRVREKLTDKHGGVTLDEIRQCFANLDRAPMIDHRAQHLTNPVTRWFIAETDRGRLLKVCYMPYPNGDYMIKTAYEPNPVEIETFTK
jgi:hypothetical protein